MCEKKRPPLENQVCPRCRLTNNDSFKEQIDKYCVGGDGCMRGKDVVSGEKGNGVVSPMKGGGLIIGGS